MYVTFAVVIYMWINPLHAALGSQQETGNVPYLRLPYPSRDYICYKYSLSLVIPVYD